MSDLGNRSVFSKNLQRYLKRNEKSRNDLCHDLGFKYTTVADWIKERTYPRIDKIEMMANYFGVEKSDLIEDKTKEQEEGLTAKDLNEVALDLERIIDGLDATYGAAGYGGTISDDDKETLRDALFMAMKIAKRQAKEKYTPKKYRDNKYEKT